MLKNKEIYQNFLKELESCSDDDFYRIVEKYFLIFQDIYVDKESFCQVQNSVELILSSKNYLKNPARPMVTAYHHSFYFNLGSIRKAIRIIEEFSFSIEEKLSIISSMIAWGCRLENLITLTESPNIIWYDSGEYFYYGLFTSKLKSDDYDWFYPILMMKSVRGKIAHLSLDEKKNYIFSLYCYFTSFFGTNNDIVNEIRSCCDMQLWDRQQLTLDDYSYVILEKEISKVKKVNFNCNR